MSVSQYHLIQKISEELSQEKIVCTPTDTLYGLLADATSNKAVEKIYSIKKRALTKPVPILFATIDDVSTHMDDIKIDKLRHLVDILWPGGLTIISKISNNSNISLLAQSYDNKIAVRIPQCTELRNMISYFGRPVTGTSANVSGYPNINNFNEFIQEICKQENYQDIINDLYFWRTEIIPNGKASTIIEILEGNIRLIREGIIDFKKIESLID